MKFCINQANSLSAFVNLNDKIFGRTQIPTNNLEAPDSLHGD